MFGDARFSSPSDVLHLGSLLKRTQHALWPGLVFTLAIHFALSQLRGMQEQQKTAKPLTTHFVKRQPRLTKPLELKKRPQPRRRQIIKYKKVDRISFPTSGQLDLRSKPVGHDQTHLIYGVELTEIKLLEEQPPEQSVRKSAL